MSAIAHGDPNEGSMLAGVARQVLSAILPGEKQK
jgi:pyruvate dehydrogenase (quinone)